MQCVDCPLALLCYTGHLGYTFLCPTCGKFVATRQKNSAPIYALFCEQRPLTPTVKRMWRHHKNRAIIIENSGPGLSTNKLLISECSLCANVFHILAQVGAVWHDLDEEAQLKKETQRHAFGFRDGRGVKKNE